MKERVAWEEISRLRAVALGVAPERSIRHEQVLRLTISTVTGRDAEEDLTGEGGDESQAEKSEETMTTATARASAARRRGDAERVGRESERMGRRWAMGFYRHGWGGS